MKKLFLLLLLTFNLEAQPMNWIMTCKEMPTVFEDVLIWFADQQFETPKYWTKARLDSNMKYFYSEDLHVSIPVSSVSHWFIPTPPISYCSGGDGGDGGPLE